MLLSVACIWYQTKYAMSTLVLPFKLSSYVDSFQSNSTFKLRLYFGIPCTKIFLSGFLPATNCKANSVRNYYNDLVHYVTVELSVCHIVSPPGLGINVSQPRGQKDKTLNQRLDVTGTARLYSTVASKNYSYR